MSLTIPSPSESVNFVDSLEVEALTPSLHRIDSAEQVVIPTASEEALQFLQSIVEAVDFKKLLFEDYLVTVSDTGKELGEFKVTVESSRIHAEPCFLVHANSNGIVDGVPCGTSIVCHVSGQLETLEQHHHEFVKLEYGSLDRKTTITRLADKYLVHRVVARGNDVTSTTNSFSLDTMKGFVSEGSNLLLHRLFISKGMREKLQFICLDSEDNICPSVYRPLAERIQKVEDMELKVLGLERSVDSKVDLPITWQSYYIRDGHLSNRVQVGSPVTMTLQKLPGKHEYDIPPKPIFEKKKLDWEEDMQLFSRFLDRKEELKNSHEVFLRHHPELKALLADFLQFLLLNRPDDVLAFSADYFASFSRGIVSGPRYIASAIPPLFPNVRTNGQIEALRAIRLDEK